jgi:arylsulfatase A-like enzyme
MRNILFITMDQIRYDALGFLGVFPVKTPNLDALAARGTVYENTYCSSPLCVPSRASIMTGKYPCDLNVYYNDQAWDESLPTLPGELSKNGYFSVGVGKMHFRPSRKYFGFDKRCADNYTDYLLHLERHGIAHDQAQNEFEEERGLDYSTRPSSIPLEHYRPVYTTDRAIHELDLIASRRECKPGGNEPFFMWYSFLLPHTPCMSPEPYFSMYSPEDMPAPVRDEKELDSFAPPVQRWRDFWRFIDDERIAKLRAQYMGCITLVDEQIGRVIDHLKKLELYDNTLIVFTSDHGDYLGDHFMQQKGFFHDCSSKVPLIIAGPDVPVNKRISGNASLIDLMPTLLSYCGLEYRHYDDASRTSILLDAESTDGVNLLEDIDPERVVVSESGIHGLSIMLRHRDIKIVYYDQTQQFDRFDLAVDPNELDNTGAGLTMENLPEPFAAELRSVLGRLAPYREKSYFFKSKIRPMFT